MKVTVLKEKLKRGLNIAEKISGRNLSLPILNNVLIEAKKNFIDLTTTDLEIGIIFSILSKTEKEGKVAVPAKILSSFINLLPFEQVVLLLKDNLLNVTSENYKTQIKGFAPDDFPIIPKVESENYIETNSLIFQKGLSRVVDIALPNQIRPEISGVYFICHLDYLKLVATDSFRLAEKTIFFENKKDYIQSPNFKNFSFILPQKTSRELVSILADNEKEANIRIYFTANQVLFELPMEETKDRPKIQVISRLIEGEYPDYKAIIPQKFITTATLPADKFINQIKTASLFSGRTNEVRLSADSQKNEIEISSQNPEVGENSSAIKGKIEGKNLNISFNWKFLLDGISNIKSQEVILNFSEDGGPVLLKGVGDKSYLYIVMPIKNI